MPQGKALRDRANIVGMSARVWQAARFRDEACTASCLHELHDQVWDKAVANARERAEKTLKNDRYED